MKMLTRFVQCAILFCIAAVSTAVLAAVAFVSSVVIVLAAALFGPRIPAGWIAYPPNCYACIADVWREAYRISRLAPNELEDELRRQRIT